MWRRFLDVLRCPLCGAALRLHSFVDERIALSAAHVEQARARGVWRDDFDVYVNAGLLSCEACSVKYPIVRGLPVLLPYATPLHAELAEAGGAEERRAGTGLRFPHGTPVRGEEFVLKSFSREWLDYDYDGVIWELSYEAHQERILKEIGPALASAQWCLE